MRSDDFHCISSLYEGYEEDFSTVVVTWWCCCLICSKCWTVGLLEKYVEGLVMTRPWHNCTVQWEQERWRQVASAGFWCLKQCNVIVHSEQGGVVVEVELSLSPCLFHFCGMVRKLASHFLLQPKCVDHVLKRHFFKNRRRLLRKVYHRETWTLFLVFTRNHVE